MKVLVACALVAALTAGGASLVDELASRRITVIATHPCNVVTRRFRDGVNYRGGNLCAWRQWKTPPLLTSGEQAAARLAWRDLMRRIGPTAASGTSGNPAEGWTAFLLNGKVVQICCRRGTTGETSF